jgi:hypothetical protein
MTSPSPPGVALAPNLFRRLGNETAQRSAKERGTASRKLRTALRPVAAQNPFANSQARKVVPKIARNCVMVSLITIWSSSIKFLP